MTSNRKFVSLADLVPGEHAAVSALRLGGAMRRRLLDIGLAGGTPVECVGRSPGGGMSAYRIRGAVIAIRDGDAREILVSGEVRP